MTMGLTARKYPGALAVIVVLFSLFCQIFGSALPAAPATEALEILDISSPKGDVGKDSTLSCSALPEDAEIVWMFKEAPVKFTDHVKHSTEKRVLPRKDADGNPRKYTVSNVTITNATAADAGNYTCLVRVLDEKVEKTMVLDLSFPGRLVEKTAGPIKQNLTDQANITLRCVFEIYKPQEVKWSRKVKDVKEIFELKSARPKQLNLKQVESTLDFRIHSPDDDGTYVCQIYDDVTQSNITGEIELLIYATPQVVIDKVIPISSSQLFLNWTVKAYNSKIKGYNIMYRAMEPPSDYQQYTREKISVENTSFVMNGLEKSTLYQLKLEVNTEYGPSKQYLFNTTKKTLDKDPIFTPNISINGFSATSVTIGWAPPPDEIAELIHYYLLEAKKKDDATSRNAYHSRDNRNLPYMFDNLEPYSKYIFRVCACSDYTKTCGNWSEEMEAATLDGTPGKPSNVTMHCNVRELNLTWEPPLKPNAEIKTYTMELFGKATFKDRYGITKEDVFGPKSKFMTNDSRSVRFDSLKPNTNYTVRLSAMTRTRRRGEDETKHCATAPAPPDSAPRPTWRKDETKHCATAPAPPDSAPRPTWRKIFDDNRYMFKMYLPRVTERNGPICCYRVYMVRILPHFDWNSLPSPKDIAIIAYEEAHGVQPMLGAYLTDVFSNNDFPTDELVMGDEKTFFHKEDPTFAKDECLRCLKIPKRAYHDLPIPKTTTPAPTTPALDDVFEDDVTTSDPEEQGERRRREAEEKEPDYMLNSMMKDPQVEDDKEVIVTVKDGRLDSTSNYTLFIELIPGTVEDDPLYSEYLNILTPAPTPISPVPSSALEIALQVSCAVAALLLVCAVTFCILQSRKSRKLPHNAHVELNPIHAALRYVVGHMGGRQHVSTAPRPDMPPIPREELALYVVGHMGGRQHVSTAPRPDMPPIPREELAAAYAERHCDSDYGFQKEFELLQMLPECYPDRTTHASEARENQPKNRYPDIKAYDQTRVKLTPIDGVPGSDYINANYVMGYKESKQFICAQGPTDTTVNDFWRMIWEHGLELIVMLTNLEEYSKVKCSKYWPDEVRGTRAFGAITVHHVSEKRYSDYIVRELQISKQATTADGQPIVENNGIVKRNGDIGPASDSAPTSPRERKNSTTETRVVKQYHFLMWKDFAAPEYPHSILKFIKRVNEAWSSMVGRPVVVHCSAGVGRTGTLVALDWLLAQLRATDHAAVFNCVAELRRHRNFLVQSLVSVLEPLVALDWLLAQLRATDHAAVFNCVAELRRHRNFLVQSLKQYVFVYRALVEYAHYGDTEIPASRLKTTIDRLRSTPDGGFQSLMEIEFEKMLNSPVIEPVKSTAAGAAEELRSKNRTQDVLPYDRNRVILPPIPGREFSTYINASFIEAYDNSEGYIITQDPLPNTICDFWRMVAEHNITSIVMLSEVGEGKCPRYWDDGTVQYDHISVEYEESESCPYYTRRQFKLTNNKSGETSSVRHVQYQGWPTAPGHVPEVTRGLTTLAAAAVDADADHRPPLLLHCLYGTERSALFVALCILICQLRTEGRVDVNVVARKLRAQRSTTIHTLVQYEFLHRAILNYAELHNLLEDS